MADNDNTPTLAEVVQAYENLTDQTPDTTDFAYIQAIVRDEQNKEK